MDHRVRLPQSSNGMSLQSSDVEVRGPSRREVLAMVSAVGAGIALSPRDSIAQMPASSPRIIDTHHHIYPPEYTKRNLDRIIADATAPWAICIQPGRRARRSIRWIRTASQPLSPRFRAPRCGPATMKKPPERARLQRIWRAARPGLSKPLRHVGHVTAAGCRGKSSRDRTCVRRTEAGRRWLADELRRRKAARS